MSPAFPDRAAAKAAAIRTRSNTTNACALRAAERYSIAEVGHSSFGWRIVSWEQASP